jgi:hypothetical protein
VRSPLLWNFVFTGVVVEFVAAVRYVTVPVPAGVFVFLAVVAGRGALGVAGWWLVVRPEELRDGRRILGQPVSNRPVCGRDAGPVHVAPAAGGLSISCFGVRLVVECRRRAAGQRCRTCRRAGMESG